jgi:nucleoside 2-deoxyribosyltransferase
LTELAIEDLQGVEDCDILVVMALAMSAGKATEMGYAIKAGKPVIIVYPKTDSDDSNIFYHHPAITDTVRSVQELCIAVWDVELRRLNVTETL